MNIRSQSHIQNKLNDHCSLKMSGFFRSFSHDTDQQLTVLNGNGDLCIGLKPRNCQPVVFM
ncbi:hypothetical protein F157LOC_01138 [Pectobacterium brasiliense]|nr:hypothetical protein F157LOC_01138 [Pectobacterium brasiliense]